MNFSGPEIIIELGSYCCKAGFSCDNHPVSIFRTVVGRPSNIQGFYGKGHYDVYVGEEAFEQDDYEIFSPIVKGRIVHWDNLERVWHHIFYKELKVAPEERAVMVTTDPRTTMKEKYKFCEIFFETLNVPALCVQPQSIMSLYGSGFTTGISVDLGYDITEINPAYEGGLMTYARLETYFSGGELANFMNDSLLKRGIDLGENRHAIIEDIKRQVLYIPPSASTTCPVVNYTLPSGKVIDVGHEVHCASELIFNPGSVEGANPEILPLPEAVVLSATKCDEDLQNELFGAVVVTGGLSAIPGLRQRLAYELVQLVDREVNIPETPEPYTVAWLGAAVYAGMQDSQKVWVLKKQYEEYGDKIIRNKFV